MQTCARMCDEGEALCIWSRPAAGGTCSSLRDSSFSLGFLWPMAAARSSAASAKDMQCLQGTTSHILTLPDACSTHTWLCRNKYCIYLTDSLPKT